MIGPIGNSGPFVNWTFDGNYLANFMNNCVAGVVSAILVLVGLRLYRAYWAWKTFSPMAGNYEECTMPSGAPTSGTIKIKSKGTTLLTEAVKKDGHILWRGVVNMNPLSPNIGDGVYSTVGSFDCGTHHLQRDPETKDFVVMGSNKSDPDGKERFNLLWRRKTK
jgi:hypothetical protein